MTLQNPAKVLDGGDMREMDTTALPTVIRSKPAPRRRLWNWLGRRSG